METYVCGKCGYRKTQKGLLDYELETPMYNMFDSLPLTPFMNVQNMYGGESACPNCGSVTDWKSI